VNLRDARRYEKSTDPAVRAEARRVLDARDERRARSRILGRRKRAPGLSREDRAALDDAAERQAKHDAYARAGRTFHPSGEVRTLATCECVSRGVRCREPGVAADHVIGGSSKSDMERIGADGFQILCVQHNHLKTVNSPTRAFWLDEAEEHALRVGARRLLPFIARARAKLEGKRRG
jgi:hypothetical protein